MQWGFGRNSRCSDNEITEATRLAFQHLEADRIVEAAWELVKLPRIGISRASKILALSDQDELGIYDSRSAHGLSDLIDSAGRRIVPIPPGRAIAGDAMAKKSCCVAFQKYTWVLRHLRSLARNGNSLRGVFARFADLEIAFFTRSRSGDTELPIR
jgi:hypothetical protein